MVEVGILEHIQQLQFTDRPAAEQLLGRFITDVFALPVASVELRPLAVSLNSFNGFVTLDDERRLFFKSHVEPGSVIAEYYNSDLLQQAGYPIIRPVAASTEPGQQMLLYEVVEDRSVFDVAWEIERSPGEHSDSARLAAAQARADDALLTAYRSVLQWAAASVHAAAPIHQLFYHRLTRGRLDEFYAPDVEVTLPGIGLTSLARIRAARWQINGVAFSDTLEDVIQRAIRLLRPDQAGPMIVGHGDAHNGNVFLRGDSLVYFDPAFAGRHDPLLDLVKPLYHNVNAMWMYFPQVLKDERGARLEQDGDHFSVTYPVELHPVRMMFWQSKTERVLIPLLRHLRAQGWLREDWRAYLLAGLACCPLLTMNLADQQRFPPEITLLGLTHVMEMGAVSEQGSRIERWLDDVEAAL